MVHDALEENTAAITIHQIVRRGNAYRIEAITPTGERWFLWQVYHSERAAMKRLTMLRAMAEAGMPEREAVSVRR